MTSAFQELMRRQRFLVRLHDSGILSSDAVRVLFHVALDQYEQESLQEIARESEQDFQSQSMHATANIGRSVQKAEDKSELARSESELSRSGARATTEE